MVQIRVSPKNFFKNTFGSGGIRTHASEETGALNQRLRPLGHTTIHTMYQILCKYKYIILRSQNTFGSGGIRTHASEETGALKQRLRPLGHTTTIVM